MCKEGQEEYRFIELISPEEITELFMLTGVAVDMTEAGDVLMVYPYFKKEVKDMPLNGVHEAI